MRAFLVATAVFLAGFTVVPEPTHAKMNCSGRGCIDMKKRGRRVDIYLVNKSRYTPLTFKLDFRLRNMKLSRPNRVVYVPPGTRKLVQRLRPRNRRAASYDVRYRHTYGSHVARHDDAYRYLPPWRPGTLRIVSQGCNDTYTHKGPHAFAIDVGMAVGTPVHAARGGRVIHIKEDSERGGPGAAYMKDGNEIVIAHDDTTLAAYSHLQKDGAVVKLGERVEAGDLIGYSGNTGWSTNPHLHFEVYQLSEKLRVQSVEVTFRTAVGEVTCPKRGAFLVAPPAQLEAAGKAKN